MISDAFTADAIRTGETRIFVRQHRSGPPILLLHGFPQTHVMWRGVAPRRAPGFTVVCADQLGFGRSGCPAAAPDHPPYAKHAMAQNMVGGPSSSRSRTRPASPTREDSRDERPLSRQSHADVPRKPNRLPRGATSGGGGYVASDVIARDLRLNLWWHPVNARRSLERLADPESA